MDSPRLGGFGERFGIERDGRMMDPWFTDRRLIETGMASVLISGLQLMGWTKKGGC